MAYSDVNNADRAGAWRRPPAMKKLTLITVSGELRMPLFDAASYPEIRAAGELLQGKQKKILIRIDPPNSTGDSILLSYTLKRDLQ
jgi:hypothetical protein